jgi:hypothetical protein
MLSSTRSLKCSSSLQAIPGRRQLHGAICLRIFSDLVTRRRVCSLLLAFVNLEAHNEGHQGRGGRFTILIFGRVTFVLCAPVFPFPDANRVSTGSRKQERLSSSYGAHPPGVLSRIVCTPFSCVKLLGPPQTGRHNYYQEATFGPGFWLHPNLRPLPTSAFGVFPGCCLQPLFLSWQGLPSRPCGLQAGPGAWPGGHCNGRHPGCGV